ncbi:MAG: O-antigen ligase family protein [Patescibacteria group bacterium]|nr:O-antigen ligase family protein [Patescibacteria group bacterium]
MDYLTYSLYAFEIFLGLAFVFWVLEFMFLKKKIVLGDKKILISILLLVAVSFLSLFFAFDRSISLYYIVVLLELLIFYIFVINQLQKKENLFIFLNVFLFTMLLQSIIAILQFVLNRSLGLSLLGESPLSADLAGVAKTIIYGAKHIRSYGTFPHPNILALFLTVAGIINIYLFKITNNKKYRSYLLVLFLFSTLALFLTFSRIAWVLALVFWGIYIVKSKFLIFNFVIFKKYKNKKNFALLILFVIILIAGLVYFAPAIWWRMNPFLSTTWESLDVRLIVFEKSWILIKSHIWGIGIGNFVIAIAYQLAGYPVWMAEPVHNSFVLVLAETGFLGLLCFLAILFFVFLGFKKLPDFLKYIFLITFIYMFFDHCFWDIRQTQFLLFLVLALASLSIAQKSSHTPS